MKWKSLLAAALTAAVALPALAQDATGGGTPSLSFSFANNRDGSKLAVVSGVVEADTEIGVEPVPANKWIELYDSDADAEGEAINNTETVSANDERAHNFTLESDVTVTYSAKNAWSAEAVSDQVSSSIQPFLQSYLDDGDNPAVDGNTVGAKFSVTGIPFESYDVIIYFATDKQFAVGSGNGFLPVTVNGTAYSWTQWQSETDSGYLVSDAASTAVFGSAPESTAILGKNAIRIPALSGDLSVVGAVGNGETSKRCSIAAFQIVEAKPSININFAQTAAEPYDVPASDAYGLEQEPGAAWQNIYGSSGTDVPLSLEAYGLHTDAKLTFSAPGTWRFPNGTQVKDPILRGFLGTPTNAANGSTVSVSDIPFTQYDVIVYFATNEENAVFQPVTINEKSYTWDSETQTTVEGETTFGSSRGLVSEYGRNALRITGLTGDLSLQTGAQTVKTETEPFKTGNLCGIQIVCTGEVTDAAVPLERNPTISVNFARGRGNGNPIVRDVTRLETQALAVVPGDAWANLYPSSTDCDDTVTLSSIWKANLTVPVRVSYQANGTWSDNVEGRPAFLKTFLGDGAYGNKIGSDILVSQIPFSEYEAIVYLATDTTSAQFLPVEINGKLYKGNGTDATVEAVAITETYGDSSVLTPTEGVNVIRVGGLSGDLRIKGSTQIRSNNVLHGRCNIAAFQIVCTGEVIDPEGPVRGVISLNYASGTNNAAVPDTAQLYGLEAAPGTAWADLTGAPASTQNFTAAYGASIGQMSTTFSAGGTYQYGADQNVNPFMRGYLDDNSGDNGYNHVSISVPNIPFDLYDVIVYTAVEQSSQDFKPVQVNGTYYTFDDAANGDWRTEAVEAGGASFGQGNQPIAKIGVNAIRVNNQDAQELSVNGQSGGDGHRGGIAAIQIIERPVQEITVSTEMTAQEVFAQALPGRATKLAFAEGGALTGAVNLSGVAVDLTQVAASPFSGDLTVNANTKLYLPANTRAYTLTKGSVTGTLAAGNVFVGGTAIPAEAMKQNGANLTFNIEITYNWTGKGTDTNWSTPGNWSSHAVPTAEADVTIPLDANGAVTIELPSGAVAKSVTITGPESGSPTLALTSADGETGSLTVSGQMLTTGNVTVTQSADITVNGKSTMVYPSGAPQTYPERGAFHVEGAQTEYKVVDGTLSVPTTAEVFGSGYTDLDQTAGGFVVVCDNAKLTVGGGNAEAVLSVYSCRMPWPSGYPASGVALAGTVEVLSSGVFETDKNANFAGGPKLVTNGGTVRVKESSASVTYGSGYAPTSPLTLSAPEGAILTFSAGESGTLLTGSADVSIEGPGTVALVGAIDAQTYTGEISVQETGNLTLADNQRPKLSVASGASLTVTPSDTERENGSIVFPTSMMTEPGNVTYTVSGLAEGTTVKASVDANKLTLYWTTDYPTLSTSSNWSTTANWTNLPEETTPTYPDSGSVTLDGTQAAITVTLDTDLSKMTSIFVKGNVTLVTNGTESTTIPACVALTTGATLTIDANFSGEWTLPAGYTLQVTKGFTSFADLTLEGAVVILEGASGTTESPTKIGAPNVEFNGGLTIAASNLTLESMFNVGKTLALNGSNITLAGGGRFLTDNGTQVVNTGSYNAITGVTGLNGSLAVNSGTLALTLAGDQPTITSFLGATIAKDATLTLVGPSGWFPATGAGTLVLEGAYRPQFAVVTVGETSATDIPAKIILSATADEQDKGLVRFLTSSAVTIPDGFVAEVKPYEAPVWVPAYVRQGTWGIDICNVPAPSGLTGLEEAVALAIRRAAAEAGFTDGDYTVWLTTKEQTSAATAATLNDVLGCFTGLKPTADGTKLTYAYDFGVVGIKRNTTDNGWVVTAKVQGANAAQAGFAEGNVYALKVKVPGETGSERIVNVTTVDEANIGSGTVELTVTDTALEVEGLTLDDGFTLGVSVSRTAQQL